MIRLVSIERRSSLAPRRQSVARVCRHVRSRQEAGGASPPARPTRAPRRRARRARRPVHPRPPRPAPLTPKPSRRTAITQGEAAKKGGLLNTLLKVAPWKITGPASGPEWQEVPIGAEDYRVVAPACVPPRSLFLPPGHSLGRARVRKDFRENRAAVREVFFSRRLRKTTDIILTIKNYPSSSVPSLCSH